MAKLKQMILALGLIGLCACVGPQTYRNEYVTANNPTASYKKVALNTDGFFADQLALAMKKSMTAQGLVEGPAEVSINVSSRINVFARKEGWFKRRARPAVTTLTVQVVRGSDQEIIYSLVKQYEILIDRKKGVITEGWVDKATEELAGEVARNLLASAK